jgi:general secretion pathway protein H
MSTAFALPTLRVRAFPGAAAAERGLTLIELLVTIAMIGILTTGIVFGLGAITNARMRGAAGMITGAVRIAFTRASATSRPNRLVFDIDNGAVILEETRDVLQVRRTTSPEGRGGDREERDAIATACAHRQGRRRRALVSPRAGAGVRPRHERRASHRQWFAFASGDRAFPDGPTSGRAISLLAGRANGRASIR